MGNAKAFLKDKFETIKKEKVVKHSVRATRRERDNAYLRLSPDDRDMTQLAMCKIHTKGKDCLFCGEAFKTCHNVGPMTRIYCFRCEDIPNKKLIMKAFSSEGGYSEYYDLKDQLCLRPKMEVMAKWDTEYIKEQVDLREQLFMSPAMYLSMELAKREEKAREVTSVTGYEFDF